MCYLTFKFLQTKTKYLCSTILFTKTIFITKCLHVWSLVYKACFIKVLYKPYTVTVHCMEGHSITWQVYSNSKESDNSLFFLNLISIIELIWCLAPRFSLFNCLQTQVILLKKTVSIEAQNSVACVNGQNEKYTNCDIAQAHFQSYKVEQLSFQDPQNW